MGTKRITGNILLGYERYATNLHNEQLTQNLQIWVSITAGIIIGSLLSKALAIRIPEKLLYLMGIASVLVATNYARQLICKKRITALLFDSESAPFGIETETKTVIWTPLSSEREALPIFAGTFRIRTKNAVSGTEYILEGEPHRDLINYVIRHIATEEKEHYFKVKSVHIQIIPHPVTDSETISILQTLIQCQNNKEGV